jgi:uncharacterized protein (TIRG00374 family)
MMTEHLESPDNSEKKKINWQKWIRWVGTGVFLVLIFVQFDIKEVWSAIRFVDFRLYLVVFAFEFINRGISSFRWKLSLKAQNIEVPFFRLFFVFLYGQALNLIMPSTIGGDSYRIYEVVKDAPDNKTGAATATLFDRGIGLVSLAAILYVTLFFNPYAPEDLRLILLLGLTVVFLLGILVVYFVFADKVAWIRKLLYFNKLQILFDKIVVSLKNYRKTPWLTLQIFLVSIFFQTSIIFVQAFTYYVVGVRDVPVLFYFYVIPVVTLILVLPISIGGVGLREYTFANLMAPMGVTATHILIYSLIGYSFQILIGLGSLLIGLFNDMGPKKGKELVVDETEIA